MPAGERLMIFYDDEKRYQNEIRQMWHTIFKDPVPYEDFYFQTMYLKNRVLLLQKEQEIAGMIHLNPYRISVNGESMPLHYIVGVATIEKCRRQGVMRNLLVKCLQDLSKAGEVFTYLMPADVRYYAPFDFVPVQSFRMQEESGRSGESGLSVLPESSFEEAKQFANDYCRSHFSVFTEFDEKYLDQLCKEVCCEHGDILIWKEKDKITGFCCYDQDENIVYIRQLFCEDLEGMIKELRTYFPGKMLKLTLDGKETGNGDLIMARILRLDRLMKRIQGKTEKTFTMHIQDSIIEDQNGDFLITVTPESCQLKRTKKTGSRCISIEDLTKIIFGFCSRDLLEKYPEFSCIKPLTPVMIGEII